MDKVFIQAEPRDVLGRKVKSLRGAGLIPAVVYGHGFGSVSIQVPAKDFERVYTEAGESTIVYVKIGDTDHPTIIHDVMRDPISDIILHADFYKVRLDEKIDADIELNFIGEPPVVKNMGGILIKNISEIKVEGFPQDLPHSIDVDLTSLNNFGNHILVKDLPISKKLTVKTDLESIVVLVQEPISEDELKAQLETPTTGVEDVEVIKKEKPEEEAAEGEEPASEPTPEK